MNANSEFEGDTAALPCNTPNGLGGYNREYVRTNGDPIIIAYVFGTCDEFEHKPTGLNEVIEMAANVFPNPFNSTFNVVCNSTISNVIIQDLSGRVVANVLGKSSKTLTIDAENLGLTSGLYIVTVKDVNNAEMTLKVAAQ